MLRTIISDKANKFLVFSSNPVTLLDCRFFVLIKFVLALWIISSRDEPCYIHPVIFIEFLRTNFFSSTIFLDGPLKQHGFLVSPVLLCIKCFLAGELSESLEYLTCLSVIYFIQSLSLLDLGCFLLLGFLQLFSFIF